MNKNISEVISSGPGNQVSSGWLDQLYVFSTFRKTCMLHSVSWEWTMKLLYSWYCFPDFLRIVHHIHGWKERVLSLKFIIGVKNISTTTLSYLSQPEPTWDFKKNLITAECSKHLKYSQDCHWYESDLLSVPCLYWRSLMKLVNSSQITNSY